jgi:hypothetical protein
MRMPLHNLHFASQTQLIGQPAELTQAPANVGPDSILVNRTPSLISVDCVRHTCERPISCRD